MKILICLPLLLMACNEKHVEFTKPIIHDYSQYDVIVRQDLNNKQQELNILREIFRAQENQDSDAFKFFLSEYMEVDRLTLSDEAKLHPEYKPWLSIEVIKSGDFMKESYNYE